MSEPGCVTSTTSLTTATEPFRGFYSATGVIASIKLWQKPLPIYCFAAQRSDPAAKANTLSANSEFRGRMKTTTDATASAGRRPGPRCARVVGVGARDGSKPSQSLCAHRALGAGGGGAGDWEWPAVAQGLNPNSLSAMASSLPRPQHAAEADP